MELGHRGIEFGDFREVTTRKAPGRRRAFAVSFFFVSRFAVSLLAVFRLVPYITCASRLIVCAPGWRAGDSCSTMQLGEGKQTTELLPYWNWVQHAALANACTLDCHAWS